MKFLATLLTALLLILSTGCNNSEEALGDKETELASSAKVYHEKILHYKKAFVHYDNAIKENLLNEKEIPLELKNKYLLLTITRLEIIAKNDGIEVEVIGILRKAIERFIKEPKVDPSLKDRYAKHIEALSQNSFDAGNLTKSMEQIDFAISIASKKDVLIAKKKEVSNGIAENELAKAKDFYGKGRGSSEDNLQAEFYTKVALTYDSTNAEALKLLSKTRRTLKNSYSAYQMAVVDYPDTKLFDKINCYPIYMAVTSIRGRTIRGDIYNKSYKNIVLKPSYFKMTNEKGQSVIGKSGSFKAKKNFLKQKFETTFSVTFPRLSGKVKSVSFMYENDKDIAGVKYLY